MSSLMLICLQAVAKSMETSSAGFDRKTRERVPAKRREEQSRRRTFYAEISVHLQDSKERPVEAERCPKAG